MKAIENYNDVQAMDGDFKRLPAGGYVCRITKAEDVPEKEYLKIEYDIESGEFKDWWSDTAERAGFWGGHFIRSYKESAAGFFKGFTNAVEASNHGYAWNWDERSLVGKYIGIVLGEEEYRKNSGDIGTRLNVTRNMSVEDIKSGNFKIPELKKLQEKEDNNSFSSISADDPNLPF